MGTPFNKNDVPDLLDKFVHFASPRFPSDPPCVNGKVKYIQATKAKPSVVYVKPFGEDYLVRVDVDCYQAKEQIEEYEQHSSHWTPDAQAPEAAPHVRHQDDDYG